MEGMRKYPEDLRGRSVTVTRFWNPTGSACAYGGQKTAAGDGGSAGTLIPSVRLVR